MLESIFEPLTQQVTQRALLGGSMVAIVCGVIGCYVILRRMAFLGDALSHAMLAGVTAGYLFMQVFFHRETHAGAMLIGSVLAGLFTVAAISFVARISRIKEDTAIGIMYTGVFAVGALLASHFSDRIHVDIFHFVIGSVFSVTDSELWMMGLVTSSVLAVAILFYRQLQVTSFDPVMASSIGISVIAFDYLLTACTSLVVVSAVPLVGVILVVGLLVTPAATAYLICDRLSRMQVLAAVFGVTAVVGGIGWANWVGTIAPGPAIVCFATLQFLLTLLLAPRYGILADWLRKRAMVPQRLVEDVLGCFRNDPHEAVPISTIHRFVDAKPEQIRRAIRWLDRCDWIETRGDALQLTAAGRVEASRLIRSHRLWETYLKHLGMPSDELHERAHVLEHLHDNETVDYLDDKLGHPLTDPHGSEIPEDLVQLIPGSVVKIALLREGHSGTINAIDGKLTGPQLTLGGHVVVGPRRENDEVWTIRLADGRWIELDHSAADSVLVQLDRDTPDRGRPDEGVGKSSKP